MKLVDNINSRMGPGTLFYGSQEVKKIIIKTNNKWHIRCHYKSPCYTTNWNELPKVN